MDNHAFRPQWKGGWKIQETERSENQPTTRNFKWALRKVVDSFFKFYNFTFIVQRIMTEVVVNWEPHSFLYQTNHFMNGEQISSPKKLAWSPGHLMVSSHTTKMSYEIRYRGLKESSFQVPTVDLHLAEFLLQRLKPQNCSCFSPFFLQTSQDGHGEVDPTVHNDSLMSDLYILCEVYF